MLVCSRLIPLLRQLGLMEKLGQKIFLENLTEIN